MKISTASIALLGLPVALAAILPAINNANPTGSEPSHGLPEPSSKPTTLGTFDQQESKQEITDTFAEGDNQQRQEEQHRWWHDLLRRAANPVANAVAASPPVHNTFTQLNKTSSATVTTAAPSGTTEVAVFTAAGAIFTVTEISGHAAVDGKSLVPGGPAQLIGGEYISEGTKGAIVVDGETLTFEAYSGSSSSQTPNPSAPASTVHLASSASSAGVSGSTSSSSGGVAEPLQTAAVKVVVAIGVVAGAIVL